MFWISMVVKPIPNSTADKTKKKKVKAIKLMLSKKVPKLKTIR